MTTAAHIFVAITTLISVLFVARMLRRHNFKSKYALLWLGVALIMAVLASFPGLIDNASYAVGVDYPPAAFLGVAVAFLLLVVVQFSWELSRLEERSRVLAEEVAFLRAEQELLSARVSALGEPAER
jgi:uncharacterized membrane protein YfcA